MTSAPDVEEALARGRTTVAWGRTSLSTAALGVLFVRLGFKGHSALEIAGGAALWICCVGFAVTGRAAYRQPSGRVPRLALLAGSLGVLGAGALGTLGAFRPLY
ncbi:MAG: DUF202 domain-containing protein [Jatrophihabitantaceae bacterium]